MTKSDFQPTHEGRNLLVQKGKITSGDAPTSAALSTDENVQMGTEGVCVCVSTPPFNCLWYSKWASLRGWCLPWSGKPSCSLGEQRSDDAM